MLLQRGLQSVLSTTWGLSLCLFAGSRDCPRRLPSCRCGRSFFRRGLQKKSNSAVLTLFFPILLGFELTAMVPKLLRAVTLLKRPYKKALGASLDAKRPSLLSEGPRTVDAGSEACLVAAVGLRSAEASATFLLQCWSVTDATRSQNLESQTE